MIDSVITPVCSVCVQVWIQDGKNNYASNLLNFKALHTVYFECLSEMISISLSKLKQTILG